MKSSVLSYFALVALVMSAALNLTPTFSVEQNVGICESVDGGSVDVFTQRGGLGASAPAPPFCLDSAVILYACVTYNGWPEQNSDVAFQTLDSGGSSFILVGRANSSGIAAVRFQLPSAEYSDGVFGTWTVVGSVDIAEASAEDVLRFNVKWNLADVNQDLKVDIYDVVFMSLAYASTSEDVDWDSQCDVAAPYGIVDICDIAFAVANYGERYSSPA